MALSTFTVVVATLVLSGATFSSTLQLETRDPKDSIGCLAKARPPQNAYCSQNETQGYVPNPIDPFVTYNNLLQNECADACGQDAACRSYQYKQDDYDGTCMLYNQTLSQQGYVGNQPSAQYYFDRPCYKCAPCKVSVTNGGFELGTVTYDQAFETVVPDWRTHPGQQDDGVSLQAVSPGRAGSKYAGQFLVPPQSCSLGVSGFGAFSTYWNWCKGKHYTLQFYYKLPTPTNTSMTVLVGGLVFFNTSQFTGDWQRYRAHDIKAKNAHGSLDFDVTANDCKDAVTKLLIDDFTVEAV